MKEFVYAIIGAFIVSIAHYVVVVRPQVIKYETERDRIQAEIKRIKGGL